MSITERITASNKQVDDIISKFPFQPVQEIMKQFNIGWLHHETNQPFIPTIAQLQAHCTMLLDSAMVCKEKEAVFRASYFIARKMQFGLELLFVPYSQRA